MIKPYKERELHTTLEITLYKHRMEKRIREHERWLDTLLRSIGDGVITVGIDGLLTSMSHVAEMLTGLSESELIKIRFTRNSADRGIRRISHYSRSYRSGTGWENGFLSCR